MKQIRSRNINLASTIKGKFHHINQGNSIEVIKLLGIHIKVFRMESSHILFLEVEMMIAMEHPTIKDPLIIIGNQIRITKHHTNHIASKKKMIRIIKIKIDRNIQLHHASSKIHTRLVQDHMINLELVGNLSVRNTMTVGN